MIDVLALPLEEARRVLEGAGLTVEVSETRPPRGGEGRGPLRVIRQHQEGQTAILTVTHERYERPGAVVQPDSTETRAGSR